jgi:hypothetical protein
MPKKDSTKPFYRVSTFDKYNPRKKKKEKVTGCAINFGLKVSDNNMVFVEAFDSPQDIILTMDKDNNKIEVAWEDRFDDEVIEKVANYRKYTVDLGDAELKKKLNRLLNNQDDLADEELKEAGFKSIEEVKEEFSKQNGLRQTFITQYDLVQFMKKNFPDYEGNVLVTGQIKKDVSGKYGDKFNIQNVYAIDDEHKLRFNVVMDLFYNKDSVDKSDYKEEQKIYVNGYVAQYINKEEGTKYLPQCVVFSASKYKENNKEHQAKLKYKLKYVDTQSKTYVHIPWEIVLIRGAEEIEFDQSMLTDAQKEQVELGIKTVNDFKPRGNIYGDKVYEYRLYDPDLTITGFADGLVDTGLTEKEFMEDVFKAMEAEKAEDLDDEDDEVADGSDNDAEEDVDEEDLF